MTSTVRRYATIDSGQVHVRTDDGPDGRLPMLILHQSPLSSRNYDDFIPYLGEHVQPFAFDTPGHGFSDAATGEWEIADYAAALWSAADDLGIEEAAVFARATGATIAVEMMLQEPQRVRGPVVLHGLPIYTVEERADRLANFAPPYPATDDGDHLYQLWARIKGQYPEMPAWQATWQLIDHLLSGPDFARAYRAVFRYHMPDRIPALLDALPVEPFIFYGDIDRIGWMIERAYEHLPERMVNLMPDSTDFVAEDDPARLFTFLRPYLDQCR